MIDMKKMKESYGVVSSDDLEEDGPREIYRALVRLYEGKEDWNKTSLRSEVRNSEDYEDIFNGTGDPISLDLFKNLVKNIKIASTRRKIHSFLYKQSNSIWESDPILVASEALSFFSSLDIKLSKRDFKDLKPAIESHLKMMRERYQGNAIGIPTGFEDLDFMLGQGLKRKEVIVPAARPSVGKTSFSLSVAFNAAKRGSRVLFVTIEMDEGGIMDRLMSFETGIPLTSIIRGKAPKERIIQGYKSLRKLPLTVQYLPSPTSAEIHSLASKHKYNYGLDLIVVDYLGLLDKDSEGDDVVKLGRTMINLKSIANILDCSVLVPHQLNRRVETRPKDQKDPLLSDLRGSGQIEEHAAIVMFLSRETFGPKSDQVTLRISKNRYGETGKLNLKFNNLTTRFQST